MASPAFEFLKDAFNKFAASEKGVELTNRLTRAAAIKGKAALDSALAIFPQEKIQSSVEGLYALVLSPEASKGVSTLIQKLDEETIQKGLDKAIKSLDNDAVALKVAQVVKGVIKKLPMDKIEAAAASYASERPLSEQMMIIMVTSQIFPMLTAISNGSDAEVTKIVRDLAVMIPTQLIATQGAAFTSTMTPEAVAQHLGALTGKLPSAKAAAKIVHGIGKAAGKRLDGVSTAAAAPDLKKSFDGFKKDASTVIKKTLDADKTANDNKTPKKPGKKDGGCFDM